jgi:hypothetical protein
LPTNCIQSAARRMHSNSCFRQLTDSDTAHLPETRVLNPCTASRVLSVVYATEKSRENPKFRRIQSVPRFTPGFSFGPIQRDTRSQFFAERRATRLSATCPRHQVPSARDARLKHPHRREPRRRTLSPTSSATTPPRHAVIIEATYIRFPTRVSDIALTCRRAQGRPRNGPLGAPHQFLLMVAKKDDATGCQQLQR